MSYLRFDSSLVDKGALIYLTISKLFFPMVQFKHKILIKEQRSSIPSTSPHLIQLTKAASAEFTEVQCAYKN